MSLKNYDTDYKLQVTNITQLYTYINRLYNAIILMKKPIL